VTDDPFAVFRDPKARRELAKRERELVRQRRELKERTAAVARALEDETRAMAADVTGERKP
jgi:hypothetical protein